MLFFIMMLTMCLQGMQCLPLSFFVLWSPGPNDQHVVLHKMIHILIFTAFPIPETHRHTIIECWLILCVNLSRLRDARGAGKASFLALSLLVFLGEISTWFPILSEDSHLHSSIRQIQSPAGQIVQKASRRANFLSSWIRVCIFSWPQILELLVL